MAEPVLTLTTDFGTASPYVAALKGSLLSVHPGARLVDLGHDIPPQDVYFAAFFLKAAVPYFPEGTLHVVVVDPGVGTERAVLYVETGGQRLLVPDNGCWTLLPEGPTPLRVRRVTERRYWRPVVSATFHGRDVFAPVAGHLALGLDPQALGPLTTEWVRLTRREPVVGPDGVAGEVVFVDSFGNLLTNLPGTLLGEGGRIRVTVGNRAVDGVVRTYGEADPGSLVALVSSLGTLEVAEVRGNAARRLGVSVGAAVLVSRHEA